MHFTPAIVECSVCKVYKMDSTLTLTVNKTSDEFECQNATTGSTSESVSRVNDALIYLLYLDSRHYDVIPSRTTAELF